jgi:hypothetical protein
MKDASICGRACQPRPNAEASLDSIQTWVQPQPAVAQSSQLICLIFITYIAAQGYRNPTMELPPYRPAPILVVCHISPVKMVEARGSSEHAWRGTYGALAQETRGGATVTEARTHAQAKPVRTCGAAISPAPFVDRVPSDWPIIGTKQALGGPNVPTGDSLTRGWISHLLSWRATEKKQ